MFKSKSSEDDSEHVLRQQTKKFYSHEILDLLFSSQEMLSPNFSLKQVATMKYIPPT